ncbi:penicillin-binding protein activator LpoB [Pontiella agarivorans]|uniref:Penicillin-binding protein activator LpoB n=1 Tax=Pontiella agarivorans TaxID=3038953 RepID=A0ABU5MYT3_9BACT|nr:penicillin-binding protein activator LpoB [Pontiella agarivorans]MDZ8119345.1 penicillin-binding protein activator LpoB [Pontiella agarivorans]
MKSCILLSALILVSAGALTGCKTKVERVAADEQIDISGRWNDTDSQLVSQEMIADIAQRPWIEEYTAKNGKKPVVIVGTIRNLSSEHIETGTFVKDLERELINNGRVTFVANKTERGELREERKEQQTWSREETQKRLAAETGADYMLQGGIKTIIDSEGKRSVKFYQVDMEMVHLETNEKVWMGDKKIKKYVKKSSVKW